MRGVRDAFDEVASEYDRQREWVIPDIGRFYSAAIWAAEWAGETPSILDIGAGTGLFSALLLKRYPRATITLMDISRNMLEEARKRFSGNDHVHYIESDYSREEIGGRFDLICSALSIHHLAHEDQRLLYQRIYRALNPGGLFVNADQARAESEWLDRMNLMYWDDFFISGPLSVEEQAKIRRRRDILDNNATLKNQMAWLGEAGFSGVDIVYKNRTFVVLIGRRDRDLDGYMGAEKGGMPALGNLLPDRIGGNER